MKYVTIIIMLLCAGCGQKTEDEIVQNIRSSYKYKVYGTLMDRTANLILEKYNETATKKIHYVELRSLLAMTWYLTENYEFSFAETDFLLKSDDSGQQFFGQCMYVVNLSAKKCPKMANDKFQELRNGQYYQKLKIGNESDNNELMASLALIFIGFKEDDKNMVKVGGDLLNANCKLQYPNQVASMCFNIKKGNINDAIINLNELNQDKDFEKHKTLLYNSASQCIKEIQDGKITGNEAVKIILEKLIRSIMDDIMNASKNANIKPIIDNIQSNVEHCSINTPKQVEQTPPVKTP